MKGREGEGEGGRRGGGEYKKKEDNPTTVTTYKGDIFKLLLILLDHVCKILAVSDKLSLQLPDLPVLSTRIMSRLASRHVGP